MSRLAPAIILLFAVVLAVHAGETVGEVRLRTIPFGPNSNWKANDTGATEHSRFSVQIDSRSAIIVTTNRAGVFLNLPLASDHMVKIKVDGKPLTSFRFSFEGRSDHLVLQYNEFNGKWSLSDAKADQK
jgi:hypothetical protein